MVILNLNDSWGNEAIIIIKIKAWHLPMSRPPLRHYVLGVGACRAGNATVAPTMAFTQELCDDREKIPCHSPTPNPRKAQLFFLMSLM